MVNFNFSAISDISNFKISIRTSPTTWTEFAEAGRGNLNGYWHVIRLQSARFKIWRFYLFIPPKPLITRREIWLGNTQLMIDHLSAFSKKAVWLRPFFLITAAAAIIVFGYVVLVEESAEKDVYLIPSIIAVLWSLVCWVLLSFFPHVPPRPDQHQRFSKRLKIRLARGFYHLGSWIFCALSAAIVWLTVRLLSVWFADY